MKKFVFRPKDFKFRYYAIPGIPDPSASEMAARLLEQLQKDSPDQWTSISWISTLEKCRTDEESILDSLFGMYGDALVNLPRSDWGLALRRLNDPVTRGKDLGIETRVVDRPDDVPSVPLYGSLALEGMGYIEVSRTCEFGDSAGDVSIMFTEKFLEHVVKTSLSRWGHIKSVFRVFFLRIFW